MTVAVVRFESSLRIMQIILKRSFKAPSTLYNGYNVLQRQSSSAFFGWKSTGNWSYDTGGIQQVLTSERIHYGMSFNFNEL